MASSIDEYRSIRHEDALNYTVFDAQHNVDTSHPTVIRFDGKEAPGRIDNSELFPTSYGFQNTTLKELDSINEFLGQQPGIDSYKFIDMGSGKGRVILHNLVSNAPYRSYVGVEIDPALHDIAKYNLLTTTINLNKEVEFVNQDALGYDIPDEPCVLFLFHSFSDQIYNMFIEKNMDTLNKTNSYLVLVSPQEYDLDKIVGKQLIFSSTSIYIYG
jgi:hypothetical protein